MIDLRIKGLPSTIECGGKSFSIKTDFREWLKFVDIADKMYQNKNVAYKELLYLFEDEKPTDVRTATTELFKFYVNPNITPIDTGGSSGRKILDWIEDGEFIVASFLAEYGIDLTEVDYLHWHKFQALFRSLSDTSKVMQIMSYRSYRKSNKTYEEQMQRQCDIWTFPDKEEISENERLLDEFNKL